MDARVAQAIELMERQLHGRLRVADVADGVGVSVAQLTRLFRQATGKTPRAFLHELRMKRARLLVETTSLAVSVVMAQVGISDRSHFARDFRSAHGFSPRTLRVQLRVSARRRSSG